MSGADGVILDLEDSVPRRLRGQARKNAQSFLRAKHPVPVFVRLEGTTEGQLARDVEAVLEPGLAGIMLPKVDDPSIVRATAFIIDRFERDRGIAPGATPLLPMAETALGLVRLYDSLLASDRVIGTAFAGAENGDLRNDLGAGWSPQGLEMLYARSQVLMLARAAHCEIILDGVWTRLEEEAPFLQDTVLGRDMGYSGRLAIHPRQVSIIHEVYTPTREQAEENLALIAAAEEGSTQGAGALRHRGSLVDEPMVKRARMIVERARAFGVLPQGDDRG